MAQTVIGIFDNPNQAQNAVQQLVSSGISRDNIDIANASASDNTSIDYNNDDNDGIGGFFSSLFGMDDDNSRKYSHVARRGTTVTVHTQSNEESERAADLLDQYGAVDIDEQAARYGYTGSTGATTSGVGLGASDMGTGTVGMGMGATNMGMGTTDLTPSGSTSTGMNSVNMNTGAADITAGTTGMSTGTTGMDMGAGTTGMDMGTGATTGNTFTNSDMDNDLTDVNRNNLNSDQTIQVIEENLQVGKREVETGGVRLRSRIVERPVEEHLRLREERINIQRTPVNRPASSADLNNFQEGTIEMTEHAEVPVVNKEARVVEEVTLGKEVTEHDEVVRDTVRNTEVDVDNLSSDADNLRTGNQSFLDDDDRTSTDTGRNSGLGL